MTRLKTLRSPVNNVEGDGQTVPASGLPHRAGSRAIDPDCAESEGPGRDRVATALYSSYWRSWYPAQSARNGTQLFRGTDDASQFRQIKGYDALIYRKRRSAPPLPTSRPTATDVKVHGVESAS